MGNKQSRHTCKYKGCKNPNVTTKQYCSIHSCIKEGCNEASMCMDYTDGKAISFSYYCRLHTCTRAKCGKFKKANVEYCAKHMLCEMKGCLNYKDKESHICVDCYEKYMLSQRKSEVLERLKQLQDDQKNNKINNKLNPIENLIEL